LETLAAINRPALGGLKGHRSLLSALRARRARFSALIALAGKHLIPLRFAGLTALRLVLEALVGKEELLAYGEHKFR